MNKTVQVTELLNHYTNNINWDLSDPDCWGVVELPEDHIYEINGFEFPYVEEFCETLKLSEKVDEIQFTQFDMNGGITCSTLLFRATVPDEPPRFYKFDLYEGGSVTNYEVRRWADESFSDDDLRKLMLVK